MTSAFPLGVLYSGFLRSSNNWTPGATAAPKCKKCGSCLNTYCEVANDRWKCIFCDNVWNPLGISSIPASTVTESYLDLEAAMAPAVGSASEAPPNSTSSSRISTLYHRPIEKFSILLIDATSSPLGPSALRRAELKAAILEAYDRCPDELNVCIMTFSSYVRIYELGNYRPRVTSEVFQGDRSPGEEEFRNIASHEKNAKLAQFLVPLHLCRKNVRMVLDTVFPDCVNDAAKSTQKEEEEDSESNLTYPPSSQHPSEPHRCLGPAIEYAMSLLNLYDGINNGGSVSIITFGGPANSPGSCEISPPRYRDVNDAPRTTATTTDVAVEDEDTEWRLIRARKVAESIAYFKSLSLAAPRVSVDFICVGPACGFNVVGMMELGRVHLAPTTFSSSVSSAHHLTHLPTTMSSTTMYRAFTQESVEPSIVEDFSLSTSKSLSVVHIVSRGGEFSPESKSIRRLADGCMCIYLETTRDCAEGEVAYLQIRIAAPAYRFGLEGNATLVERVVTRRVGFTNKRSIMLDAMDDDACAVLIAKRATLISFLNSGGLGQSEARRHVENEIHNLRRYLNGPEERERLHRFHTLLFHLHRGPLLAHRGGIAGAHKPEQTDEEEASETLRFRMLDVNSLDCLVMIKPVLYGWRRAGGSGVLVREDDLELSTYALRSDTVLLLDCFTDIFIWIGAEADKGAAVSTGGGGRNNWGPLGDVALTLARELSNGRFPTSRVVVAREGDSHARFLRARLSPEHQRPHAQRRASVDLSDLQRKLSKQLAPSDQETFDDFLARIA